MIFSMIYRMVRLNFYEKDEFVPKATYIFLVNIY